MLWQKTVFWEVRAPVRFTATMAESIALPIAHWPIIGTMVYATGPPWLWTTPPPILPSALEEANFVNCIIDGTMQTGTFPSTRYGNTGFNFGISKLPFKVQ